MAHRDSHIPKSGKVEGEAEHKRAEQNDVAEEHTLEFLARSVVLGHLLLADGGFGPELEDVIVFIVDSQVEHTHRHVLLLVIGVVYQREQKNGQADQ